MKMLEDDVADKESLLLEELSGLLGVSSLASRRPPKKGSKKGKKRRRKKLPKTSSSLLRPLPRTVRTWKPGHLPCGSSWCSVSGCCLTSPGLLNYWVRTVSMFPYSTLSLVRFWIHACVSLRIMGDGPLYLAVACSTLSLPEEYSFPVFLGDDFRIRRILRFCV